MSLIEPVSSLSIKRAVNLYTVVLFLSFGILLYWLATDRYQVFVDYHEDIANNTTKIVAFQVNKTLKEKQRVIDIFVENYNDLIQKQANNPDDEEIHRQLEERLKKHQPDFFAFNIMTLMAEPIIGDFDGDIGDLCIEDLQHYIKNDEQNIRLHPNNNEYHYDIISKYATEDSSQLFFVSFKVDEITDLLNSTQPEKHNLILVNKDAGNLIEITAQGSRQLIRDRLDYRMNGGESLRVLAESKIKGSSWYVVDMRNEGLFDNYRNKILIEYLIAYYVFSIIVLFMRNILLNQDEKRTLAEQQLQENHNQIKKLNDQLEQLSRTDSLTGLYNRRHFDKKLNQEWNRALRSRQKLSCILLDIDYFKHYNDYYGHQAGDKCLVDISKLMKETFRRAGDIIARYGGEEFIIIMAESNKRDTQAAIEKFQKALADLRIPHKGSEIGIYVTVSAGLINQVPTKDEAIEDFIRKADEALYQAKANGRNRWEIHEG